MRYSAAEQQRVNSPFEGRGLGARHSGGGMMGGQKGATPTAGYTQGPSGGLMVGGYNPSPGSLTHQGLLGESGTGATPDLMSSNPGRK